MSGCLAGNTEGSGTPNHPGSLPGESQIDAWLQLLDDGSVQILTGKMELGQGVTTVMQQVAGEELNIHPQSIKVVLADTGKTPNEGYTAGSRSVEQSAMRVRQAAAAARERVAALAADHWNTEPELIVVRDGNLFRTDTGQEISFHELLKGNPINTQIPQNVHLKPKEAYQWVGRSIPHPDLGKIVRGQPIYVQDLVFPDMVHARIIHPPVYGAKLVEWNRDVLQFPGVLKVVEDGSFLGVLAREEYAVVQAWQYLTQSTRWAAGIQLPGVASWAEYMVSESSVSGIEPDSGNFSHSASYSKPYIMHGSIGPSCAVALYREDKMHIWSHTQGVYPLRSSISHLLDLEEGQIRITGIRGSGCYGHNGADDVAAEAAILARAYPGSHIRLQWMRADEHVWEPYGSAMRMDLAARLNSEGRIAQWRYKIWSDSHSTRPRGHAGNLVSAHYLADPTPLDTGSSVGGGTRNAEPYYDIPDPHIEDHYVKGPLRVSALRSLGAFANIFAIESFIDELAEKTNLDPLVFRLNHLSDPRAIAVIQKLQELVRAVSVEDGEGLGFAFSRYKNTASYCAVATRLFIDFPSKQVSLIKMWAVLEAGESINPDGLKNQTEGGMIQAASWALKEEVKFDSNSILSRDWASYPILRFDVIPETEVFIIDRPELPPLGAGEVAQGPAGAAVANAVYQACGKRVRDLPIERRLFS